MSALAAVVLSSFASLGWAASGTVFRDYDRDGVRDLTPQEPPVAGVTITAYGAANQACGSAVTAANGTFSFTPAVTPANCNVAQYRYEFTGGASFLQLGSLGTGGAASNVRFAAGNVTGMDFSLSAAGDYCVATGSLATQPNLVLPIWRIGAASAGGQAIRQFPHDRTGNNVTDTTVADFAQLGTTYGTAYDRTTRRLFASAYARRHVGNVIVANVSRLDRIYAVPRDAAGTGWTAPVVYAENFPTGTDPRGAGTDYINDPVLWDDIGKAGWGDIDITGDGETLYGVNLAARTLVRMPARATTLPLTPASAGVGTFAIPNPCRTLVNTAEGNTSYSVANADADFRPFGLGMEDGQVFVTGVCSAQSSTGANPGQPNVNGNRTRLWAWIARFDPVAGTFGASPVLSFRLDYPRNDADPDVASNSADWQPWTTTQAVTPLRANNQVYPMPIFSDVDFDRGDMILGLRDRLGDQSTVDSNNPTTNGGRIRGIPGGELLRACVQANGSYTLESNGSCTGINGTVTGGVGSAGNGARGPGSTAEGGEFYPLEHYVINATSFDGAPHDETSVGSIVQIPGFPQVISTGFDPFNEFDSGGVVWFNNTLPASNLAANFRGYEAYTPGNLANDLAKSNGLGDLEALCDTPPIQLGNRLWNDSNADGRQDPGEPGLANVRVDLVNNTGVLIGTTTTDANGNYAFSIIQVGASGETGTDASVTLTNAEMYGQTVHVLIPGTDTLGYGTGGTNAVPAGLRFTTAEADPNDSRDSDGVLFDPPGALYNLRVGFSQVLPNSIGASIHAIDFGFRAFTDPNPLISIGNRVYFDTDNDRVIDATEVGIAGVVMELLDETNTNVDNPNIGGIQNYTATTDAEGYYRFDNLAARTGAQAYRVRVAASNFTGGGVLVGYWSSSGVTASTDSTDAGNDSATQLTTGVVSGNVQPATNAAPVGEFTGTTSAAQNGPSGSINDDLRVDFGFYRIQMGNAVWLDSDNDGILDNGEPAASGLTVELVKVCTAGPNLDDEFVIATTTSGATLTPAGAAGANYLFTLQTAGTQIGAGIVAGSGPDGDCGAGNFQYRVQISDPQGYSPTTAAIVSNTPNGTEGQNRGALVPPTDQIESGLFSLVAGTNALVGQVGTDATGTTIQPRFDFGLIEVDWGDLPDTASGVSVQNYETSRLNNGPRHRVVSNLRLGNTVNADRETSGQPTVGANGDDLAADDEDAFAGTVALTVGQSLAAFAVPVLNNTGANATLCGYIDLNGDGTFSATESASVVVNTNASVQSVNLNFSAGTVPTSAANASYARFRLFNSTTANICSPNGLDGTGGTVLRSGEVEDYPVSISGLSADLGLNALTNPVCTAGQSHSLTATVTNTEPAPAIATVNTGTFTYVIPASYARMDWNTSFTGTAACLSGCSGSFSSISGSPGTITAQLYVPSGSTVVFTFQGIVRSMAGLSIANSFSVAHPGGLTDAQAGNNTTADSDTCGNPPPNQNTAICAVPGKDLALTNPAANLVVNSYYVPPRGVNQGAGCLPMPASSSQGPNTAISAGDLLLVIQMQDGTYANADDDGTYGSGTGTAGRGVSGLGQAGRYEFVEADAARGANGCAADEVPVTGSGTGFGLINSYVRNANLTNPQRYQVVRVPQYTNVDLGSGNLVAAPWDGSTGGVLAVDVQNTLNLGAANGGNEMCAGSADFTTVLARGFRGGGANNTTAGTATTTANGYRAAQAAGGGFKAEGLVGLPRQMWDGTAYTADSGAERYSNGDAKRGAPANAGGGGASCDADNNNESGGGGGGNGGIGGTGGDDDGCGLGGIGGEAIDVMAGSAAPNLLVMGGGGGSGVLDSATDNALVAGGRGGGIVIVRANAVTGAGTVCANGQRGGDSGDDTNLGAGGGGAGGDVMFFTNISGANNYSGVVVQANGGRGGNRGAGSTNGGAGGGGGGGRVLLSQIVGTPTLTPTVTQGAQGTGGDAAATSAAAGDLLNNLNPYNATPGAKPGFLCTNATVPVTLSDVTPTVENGQLVVRFGTASEIGTLGFNVHAESDSLGGIRSQVNTQLIVSKDANMEPQRYEARTAFAGQSQVWIEEQTIYGTTTMYGPYRVGQVNGERDISNAVDWVKVRQEQDSFRRSLGQSVISRGQSTTQAELKVSRSGWIQVSYEQLLAQGLDWSGVPITGLKLTRGNDEIALQHRGGNSFGPGSTVGFYGEAIKGSLYTSTQVYRLQRAAGNSMNTVFAGAGSLTAVTSVADRFEHAPNRRYSAAAPTDDPWYAVRLVRNSPSPVQATETFVLPEKVAGPEQIEIALWGGLDYVETPDHSVRLLLNGQEIALTQFDGVTLHKVNVTLPPGLLVSGTNTLTMELLTDTGLATDVVNLEAIRVDYQRALKTSNQELNFTVTADTGPAADGDSLFRNDFSEDGAAACSPANGAGCTAWRVSGLTSPDVVVLRQRGNQVVQLTGTQTTAVSGGFDLRFASAAQSGDVYRIAPTAGTVTASIAPVLPATDPLLGGPASYLIITHPSFAGGLAPLIAARQAEGLTVRVVNVEDIYAWYNFNVVDPIAIKMAIQDASKRLGTRYVLLVGGDTYDYFNYGGANSVSFIPTFYRAMIRPVTYAPTDAVFADTDNDRLADLAVGRLPVRTMAELDRVVTKILAYATAPHARRALFLNDRDQNAVQFREVLGEVRSLLDSSWTKSIIDLNTYPTGTGTAQARGDLVAAINGGQSLFSYFGHSAAASWTREGLVNASLLYGGLFANASAPTAVWQLGCSGSYFVEPTYNTIAHGLMLQGNGGGAAMVLGATTLTEITSDQALMQNLTPGLAAGQRVGDALRDSQRSLLQSNPELIDVTTGMTLLGDPALRVR